MSFSLPLIERMMLKNCTMSSAQGPKPVQSVRFRSLREACRYTLRTARTPAGGFFPLSVPEMVSRLAAVGFVVNERDVEGSLRELAATGEAVEIDAQAGFRWSESAA